MTRFFLWILSFFNKQQTIETITAVFEKTVSDLMTHAEDHLTKAAQKGSKAAQLVGEVQDHNDAAIKAQGIAQTVGDLLK